MKAYTRTGDKGDTGLYGGDRVPKDNARVAAYGEIDELNSQIGLARAQIEDQKLGNILVEIQKDLFTIGSELATRDINKKIPRVTQADIDRLERETDLLNSLLPQLRRFILPGGSVTASQLHVVRSVCRRAERKVVGLARNEPVSPIIAPYLNRLSSLLFVMARTVNLARNVPEQEWVHE